MEGNIKDSKFPREKKKTWGTIENKLVFFYSSTRSTRNKSRRMPIDEKKLVFGCKHQIRTEKTVPRRTINRNWDPLLCPLPHCIDLMMYGPIARRKQLEINHKFFLSSPKLSLSSPVIQLLSVFESDGRCSATSEDTGERRVRGYGFSFICFSANK